jgi:hypothetical protein
MRTACSCTTFQLGAHTWAGRLNRLRGTDLPSASRILVLIACLAVGGCAPSAASQPSSALQPSGATPPSAAPAAVGTSPVPEAARDLVERARADVAQRTGVPISEVAVRAVQTRQWPDASLGCPAPGQVRAAVITPGYQLVLTARDRQFVYHTSMSELTLCPRNSS